MRRWGAAGLVLVVVALTLAMAAPVLQAPGSRLFGSEIVGRHEAPLVVVGQFETPRPLGLYTQPATDYVGAALAALTGSGVVAFNAVVLASFPLAACFAYLLAFQLTRSRSASWLAGLLYAFAPFHLAQSAYHPHGAQIQWLPLYLLALWLCIQKASARRLLLLAASLILVAASNFYYGLMAGVLTPFAAAGFWLVQSRRREDPPRGLRGTLLSLGALAATGLTYAAIFAPAVFVERERLAFPQSDLALYGAQWWSYLLPPVGHPVVGDRIRGFWALHGPGGMLEQQITVGVGVLLLGMIGLGLYAQGGRDRELRSAPALVLIAAAAFVLSLAPSASLGDGALGTLLRPSTLIHAVLPMFRAYARFGLVVFLAASILAAAAATRLLRDKAMSKRALAVGLLGLAFLELTPFPPFRWRDVLPTSAHRFLDQQPGPIRLLDCVPSQAMAQQPFLYPFAHRVSLQAGNSVCGDPDFSRKLSAEGFTHFLVRRESPLGKWLVARSPPEGTRSVGVFEDALLFEIDDAGAARTFLQFEQGFHWREFAGDRSYRWMGGTGSLGIVNPSPEPVTLELALQLHAFPALRNVAVEVDGERIIELDVSTEPATYALPRLSLAPGRHRLALVPDSAAVVADSVVGNGDPRELSLAVWGWKIASPPP